MFSVEIVMSMWEFVNLFTLLFCVCENLHNRKLKKINITTT